MEIYGFMGLWVYEAPKKLFFHFFCVCVWKGAVWCGVVRCGVEWRGVVWSGAVWCGVVWRGVVCRGTVRFPHIDYTAVFSHRLLSSSCFPLPFRIPLRLCLYFPSVSFCIPLRLFLYSPASVAASRPSAIHARERMARTGLRARGRSCALSCAALPSEFFSYLFFRFRDGRIMEIYGFMGL